MNRFKHKILLLLTVILSTATMAHAQIFILEDDFDNDRVNESEWNLVAPMEGLDADQYVPLNGIWMLTGIGAAYLLAKRKKENNVTKKRKQ